MGQKTNPVSLRVSLNRTFDSSWYTDQYATLLHHDQSLRKRLQSILRSCGIFSGRFFVQIFPKKTLISFCFHETKQGVLSSGFKQTVQTKKALRHMYGKSSAVSESTSAHVLQAFLFSWARLPKAQPRMHEFSSGISSVLPNSPLACSELSLRLRRQTSGQIELHPLKIESKYWSADFVCAFLCQRLQEGVSFRSISQQITQDVKAQAHLQGFRLQCSGRLGGVELARVESKTYGRTSLHVYSEQIDYASSSVLTPSGLLGVKVWLSFRAR